MALLRHPGLHDGRPDRAGRRRVETAGRTKKAVGGEAGRRRPASQAGPHPRRPISRDRAGTRGPGARRPGRRWSWTWSPRPTRAGPGARSAAVVAAVAGGRAKAPAPGRGPGGTDPGCCSTAGPRRPGRSASCCWRCARAGATAISPPCLRRVRQARCAPCSAAARTGTAGSAISAREPCAGCGDTRPDEPRATATGRPRCAKCSDLDDRDPVTVIHELSPSSTRTSTCTIVAAAVHRCASAAAYQQQTGLGAAGRSRAARPETGTSRPLRAVPRLDRAAARRRVAGIVRPTCPGCGGSCASTSRSTERGSAAPASHTPASRSARAAAPAASRSPATSDGRPVCANCFITDPANLETCLGLRAPPPGRTRAPRTGRSARPAPRSRSLTCSICAATTPCGISRTTGRPWCPACQRRSARCSAAAATRAIAAGTLAHPLCADCARTPGPGATAPPAATPTTPKPAGATAA